MVLKGTLHPKDSTLEAQAANDDVESEEEEEEEAAEAAVEMEREVDL